eukprot:283981-Pleurochrysis_carterae.AAC.5
MQSRVRIVQPNPFGIIECSKLCIKLNGYYSVVTACRNTQRLNPQWSNVVSLVYLRAAKYTEVILNASKLHMKYAAAQKRVSRLPCGIVSNDRRKAICCVSLR